MLEKVFVYKKCILKSLGVMVHPVSNLSNGSGAKFLITVVGAILKVK